MGTFRLIIGSLFVSFIVMCLFAFYIIPEIARHSFKNEAAKMRIVDPAYLATGDHLYAEGCIRSELPGECYGAEFDYTVSKDNFSESQFVDIMSSKGCQGGYWYTDDDQSTNRSSRNFYCMYKELYVVAKYTNIDTVRIVINVSPEPSR